MKGFDCADKKNKGAGWSAALAVRASRTGYVPKTNPVNVEAIPSSSSDMLGSADTSKVPLWTPRRHVECFFQRITQHVSLACTTAWWWRWRGDVESADAGAVGSGRDGLGKQAEK